MADSVKESGDERHRYRICELQSREKRPGRPRRAVIIAWDDISREDLAHLRRLHEPRLTANQVAELDGCIVARGSEAAQADIDDTEPAAPPSAVDPNNAADLTEFAHRMCWDIHRRSIAASEELRKQTATLNERSLEYARQLDAMLGQVVAQHAEMRRPQHGQGFPITAQDLKHVVQAGVMLFHRFSAGDSGSTDN